MFTRILAAPSQSTLLIGPRGTGKSTWINTHFKDCPTYNLLDAAEALSLNRNPARLYRETSGLPRGSWVIIDEVQKAPVLLDAVQRLIEEKGIRFILSGSSARKLKRGGANLLAGRAILRPFFPLVSAEVGYKVGAEEREFWLGMLPTAFTFENPRDYLRTYATTYLQEEIRAEALTRNIGAFGRFLEVAARQNGQVTNVAGIARDAQVARQTVAGYFEILVDTLIGSWLAAWKLKRATKQIRHPKFYFFDAGVCRALCERLPYPPMEEEKGFLLETFLLHELRAYLSYSGLNYPIHYWSSHDRVEVDFLIEDANGYVALEVKAAREWRAAFERGIFRLRDELGQGKVRAYGIFGGARPQEGSRVPVLPWSDFLRRLWAGEIIR